MADIFISYKREDIVLAKSLADMLKKEGWSVWWDHEIPAGRDYDSVIEQELNNCKCAVVLWTPSSIHSRNVKDEANVALEQNKLLPIMVGNVQPPLGFRIVQGVKWNDNALVEQQELTALLEGIRQITGAALKPLPKLPSQARKRSFKTGIVAACCVVGLIVLLILIFKDPDKPENIVDKQLEARKHLQKAFNLVNNHKDYQGAIDEFSSSIALDSTNPEAYFGRGSTYNLQGLNIEAIEDLSKSVDLGYTRAYANIGWTLFDNDQLTDAITYFEEHLKHYKDDALSEAGAAMSYFLLAKLDSTKIWYNKAIAHDDMYKGNFGSLKNRYHFTQKQLGALQDLYSTLYTSAQGKKK